MMNLMLRKPIILFLALLMGFSTYAQDEKTAASLYNEGLALLKAKDYAGGLPILEAALEKATADGDEKIIGLAKKNGAIAASNLGNAKKKAGALDEALALYNKGIEWRPEYASNYRGLAAVSEAKGDAISAIKQYIKAGDITEASGKEKKAAKLYKKARNMVGKIYQAKDYAKAIEAGKAFLSIRENAEVAYYICRANTESVADEEAITYADKAIALSGDTVDDKYYVAKAKAYEKMGKNAEAVDAYKLVTGEKYKAQAEGKIKLLGGK
jgi:tetratricopeptide (TPR) repeat protein